MKSFDQNQDSDKPLAAGNDGEHKLLFPRPSSLEEVPVLEGWIALCARAAVEQDPKKLLELVIEINRLLDDKRKRLLSEGGGKSEGE